MTSQLIIYNEALGHLGAAPLAHLQDNRPDRRTLDTYWGGVISYCLAQGLWRFARRTTQIDGDEATPEFGFNFAFEYPDDWIRTQIISTSPDLDPPLIQYRDETGIIYANIATIYLSYISNDPLYGMNVPNWPQNFAQYVTFRLAAQSVVRVHNEDIAKALKLKDSLERAEEKQKRNAKGTDAMNDAPGLPPVPFWVRARRGAFGPGGLFLGGGTGTGGGSLGGGPVDD